MCYRHKVKVTKRDQYKERTQTVTYLRLGDEDKGWHKEYHLDLEPKDIKMG